MVDSLRAETIMTEKSWQPELEAGGYNVSTVRKQREMKSWCSPGFLLSSSLEQPTSLWDGAPHSSGESLHFNECNLYNPSQSVQKFVS